ncbi:MAG: hypothetical protein P4L81_03485, partial [Candidatus Pacebacteria bacterium]|nr:hypothetical protein [Candidatus Paceibacterota bacterium]
MTLFHFPPKQSKKDIMMVFRNWIKKVDAGSIRAELEPLLEKLADIGLEHNYLSDRRIIAKAVDTTWNEFMEKCCDQIRVTDTLRGADAASKLQQESTATMAELEGKGIFLSAPGVFDLLEKRYRDLIAADE